MISEYLINLDIYSWQVMSVIFIAGFAAGFINTFAGSGTVINYFLLVLLGIPINTASGTIRMGVIMQAFATSISFYKQKQLDVIKGIYISIPVTLGAIIGAEIAVSVNLLLFERLIGGVLIVMLFFLFFNPDRWIEGKQQIATKKVKYWHLFFYFIIGIYGGFLHIGFGIFMIAALVWISGYNLVKAAAIKIFVVLIYTPFVFIIFVLNDQVEYLIGFITGFGNLIGGLLAANMAAKYGAGFIRWILIFVLIIFSLKLFSIINF